MGVVLAGVDTTLGRRVAIKVVAPAHTGRTATASLRREARLMARLDHPAAIRLFDEGADERFGAFLVMELCEGEDLAAFVRRRRRLSPGLALAIVEQICDVLASAHDAGVLHHDIKPANVFVLRHGHSATPRIKLLDFGAGTTRAGNGGGRVLGTLAYMAPERWSRARRPGVGADVYALGALLFQMLAGKPPFAAATRAALRLAIKNDPPPFAALSAAPPRLREAIARALEKNPERRPGTVRAFARLLGLGGVPDPLPAERPRAAEVRAASQGPARGSGLIGRSEALASLMQAVAQLENGRPGLFWIDGPSGIGKTALLGEFRRRLDRSGRVVTLAGVARHWVSVPFPALDEAIAGLTAHLVQLPAPVAELLVPRHCGALGRLFPTLTQVPAVARAGIGWSADGVLPAEERRVAIDDFRELLRRLGHHNPIVLLVDDMQWLDPDSAALLQRTLGGPEPPALLVVGTVRSYEGSAGPVLRRLETSLSNETVARLSLGPLSEQESARMVRKLWAGRRPPAERTVQRVAQLSAGVPFFVEILANAPAVNRATSVEDVLVARCKGLPPRARRALELVCVSSRPLVISVLLDAIGVKPGEDPRTVVLDPLLNAALIRLTHLEGEWRVEPYHARIRESIGGELSPASRYARHRRLVALLKHDETPGAIEATIEHLAGCGEQRAAAALALSAAESANAQLAFDRASALFAVAIQHGRPKRSKRVALLRKQAMALENAGRRREAGTVLLTAAATTPDRALATTLRRETGSHLLASGDVARALDVLGPALDRAGLHLPGGLDDIAASTGAALQTLGARGLVASAWPRAVAPEVLARLDLLLELALGLAHIDLRALPFACQALLAALDVGEPLRLQRAAALFVINTVEYVPTPLVQPALALCRALTGSTAGPLPRALLDAAVAENAHFQGDFLAAEAAFERAERILLESGARASRELAMVRDLAVFVQYAHKGDFRTQLDRTQQWLAQAEAAQDAFHAGMLRVAHAIVWVARDDTQRARAELRRAQAESSGTAGVLEVAVALYYDIIDRYEGDDAALAVSGEARSALLRSPAAQTPFLSGYLGLHESWRRLRALGSGRADAGDVAAVAGTIARLRALQMGIWSAVADALEGNLQFLQGQRERALHVLETAEQTFRRMHMLCLAGCVRKRRGQFVDGELGARLEAEADSELRALGVTSVERWTAAYWSMFDARAAAERTRDETTGIPDQELDDPIAVSG